MTELLRIVSSRTAGWLPVLMLAVVFTAGCKKQPRVFIMPPLPPPKPMPAPVLIQAPPPPKLLVLRHERPTAPWFLAEVQLPGPPPPRLTTRPARPVAGVKPEAPAPEPSEPPVAAPVPQLGRIITAEERDQNLRVLQDNLTRAKDRVEILRGRRLSLGQRDALRRIESFIAQAEAARGADLIRAVNLAVRADVLSRELEQQVGQ